MTHVAVLGGGLAGTLAAVAAAPHADRVTIVERDRLSDSPGPRRGLPQARHSHGLWYGGAEAVEALLPGVTRCWLAAGARRVALAGEAAILAGSGWLAEGSGRHYVIVCGRDLLDHVVRERALTHPAISLRTGMTATGLLGTPGRVTGARLRDQATGADHVLEADLVIDATGRGSQAGRWLDGLKIPAPPENVVTWQAGYATRLFRVPPDSGGSCPLVVVQPDFQAGDAMRAAVLAPIENSQWQVTLFGAFGTRPGPRQAQDEGFADFAGSVRHPLVADLIARAEPAGPVHVVRTMRWRRRTAQGRSWPDGLVLIGDAAASFNPVLGQGMSVAARSAVALSQVLRKLGTRGSGHRLQRAVDQVTREAWRTGRVLGLLYLDPDPSLAERLFRRTAVRAFDAAGDRPALSDAVFDVMSSAAPVTRLLKPRCVLPALLGPRNEPLTQPPQDIRLPRPRRAGALPGENRGRFDVPPPQGPRDAPAGGTGSGR